MPNAKPILPPLKTPKSATFPSELHDDSSASSISIKHEEATPITPNSSLALPKAYTEFLDALTPVFSPASAGPNFQKFTFERSGTSPTSQPASALSTSFTFSGCGKSPSASLPPPTPGSAVNARKGFNSPRHLPLPRPFKYSPGSDSPMSATPMSATSLRSPYSASPYSAADWKLRYGDPRDAPRSANGKPVSVKEIVTRTVTYKRTQLDAPPKGKRRKHREGKEIKELKEPKSFKEIPEFTEIKDVKEVKEAKQVQELCS